MSINVCNDRSMASITSLPSGVSGSSLVLISTQTASSSATISFTSGINSTYKEYIFKFINIHPASDGVNLTVGFRDGGTDYDASKTTTIFQAYHNEAGNDTALNYDTGEDHANGTGFQTMTGGDSLGSDADQCIVGTLHLFNPSSTTFVKHFIARTNFSGNNNYSVNAHIAGYCNTTTAIDGVQFKMHSGNIDAGTITLYGIN